MKHPYASCIRGSSPSETQIRLVADDKSLIWVHGPALFAVSGFSVETMTAYIQPETVSMKHTIL